MGLSHTLSAEGRRRNVLCNVVAPLAASRLTAGTLPPDVLDKFTPDKVAPVVAWLCHEDCQDSGLVVEAAGGYAARCERRLVDVGVLVRNYCTALSDLPT